MLAFKLNADNTLEGLPLFSMEDMASVISNKNLNLDSSDHRTLFHYETVHDKRLNEPWPTGHNGASGPCHIWLPFSLEGLVGMVGLCLPTVFLEVFLGPI